MQTKSTPYYPISLDEIKQKVDRKNGRKKPRWLIKRYSNEGDIVFDPFSGSGTANVEALLNHRHKEITPELAYR